MKVTLDSVCESIADGDHQAPPKSTNGIPFITISCLDPDGGKPDFASAARVPREYYDSLPSNRRAQPNDVLISVVGSLGIPYLVAEGDEFVFQRHIAILRPGTGVLPEYLYYLLKSPSTFHYIDSVAQGAAQRTLTLAQLRAMEVEIPPLQVQRDVVARLKPYDTLIENSRKQIALLEEAAQRLYKEWFVDLHFPGYEKTKFIDGLPDGWKRISMLDLGDYLNGYAFKPADHFREGFPIIKIKELKDGVSSDTPRNNGLNVPAKYLIHSGDIIFSWSATLVAKIWMGEDALINQHLFKVAPKQEFSSEYVVQSINNAIAEMRGLTTGSTMTHLQRNKLGIIHTIKPSDEVMQAYTKQADAIRNASMNRERAIGLLTETRDRLLPKLMSGEIEV